MKDFRSSIILHCNPLEQISLSFKQKLKKYGFNIQNFVTENKFSKKNKDLFFVLGGGMSLERDISLLSSESVIETLIKLKYEVYFIDIGADIIEITLKISSYKCKIFNLVHGKWGEDGNLQSIFNIKSIRYTGSGVLASSASFNKKIAYDIVSSNGIDIANYQIFSKQHIIDISKISSPFIIKPLEQGSSIGIELIDNPENFDFKNYHFKYGEEVLLESFIKGKELQIAVFEGKILGILELRLLKGKKFFDYQTKYNKGFAEHIYPAKITTEIASKIENLSKKIYNIFKCKGLIRIELIYEPIEEKLYFLEINTVPGMTKNSICPEIAAHSGIEYLILVEMMAKAADYEK
ncbi:MAG: D-alanine--D-alanine ligase [Rickettsia sp.]|nr:D-alanine--D-alanine ligase [Rickettsia sp.]